MTKKNLPNPIQGALDNPDVPKLYANSFECALGIGDVILLLKNGEKTVGAVNLSHTVAKTLGIRLQEVIGFLEKKSGRSVMTTAEVERALRPKKAKQTTLQ